MDVEECREGITTRKFHSRMKRNGMIRTTYLFHLYAHFLNRLGNLSLRWKPTENFDFTPVKDVSLDLSVKSLLDYFFIILKTIWLKLSNVQIFWALETKVDYIANTITRNRYFQLRSSLKLVDDELITQNTRQNHKFSTSLSLYICIRKGYKITKHLSDASTCYIV